MTSPYVHYADANTPYGPFASGSESLDWVTLRIQSCKGRFYMPEFRDELAKLGRGGKSYHLPVDLRPVEPGRVEATLLLEREDGLAAHQVSLGDGAKFTLPLAGSSAQHVLVIRGEVVCGDRHFGPRACLEIRKEDGRVELQPTMGMSCEVLLLRYPEGELEPGREKFARSEETQTSNH